jgi:hypothetical protein
VNIGGRSKGCSTCRRRRVKCGKVLVFIISKEHELTYQMRLVLSATAAKDVALYAVEQEKQLSLTMGPP